VRVVRFRARDRGSNTSGTMVCLQQSLRNGCVYPTALRLFSSSSTSLMLGRQKFSLVSVAGRHRPFQPIESGTRISRSGTVNGGSGTVANIPTRP